MKRRALGNIRFIGELFKKEMLRENIIISCILKLLNAEEVSSSTSNTYTLQYSNHLHNLIRACSGMRASASLR
jgi:MIF4G domain